MHLHCPGKTVHMPPPVVKNEMQYTFSALSPGHRKCVTFGPKPGMLYVHMSNTECHAASGSVGWNKREANSCRR